MDKNIFTIDKQTIYLDDCKKIINTLKDKYVDQIITSPPYNIGINYSTYKDNKSFIDYLNWLYEIFSDLKRVLKDDGSIFLNIGSTNNNPWIVFDIVQKIRDLFVMQNHIIWVKNISINEISYGHYKPINSERYTNHTFEHIFHFTKNGNIKINRTEIGVPFMDKINLKAKTVTEDIRCRGNCWFIPYDTIQNKNEKGNHPAVFPKKLVEWCIKLHGYNKNTIILDPFVGSGTVLYVCKELKCNGIGIEIDKKYFNYIITNLTKQI